MNKVGIWVRTEGSFLILMALLLLLLPIRWIIAAVTAALVHEGCHYGAVRLLGGHVYGLCLDMRGAKMEVEPMTPGKELVAVLAGPVGSALLVMLARWMPRLAICGLVHCLFNLIPLFPLDGGRALHSIAALLLPPEKRKWAFALSQKIVAWCIGIGSLILTIRWGVPVAILGLWLVWHQRKMRIV